MRGMAPREETGLCEESAWTRHSRDVQRSGESANLVPTEVGSTRTLCPPGRAQGGQGAGGDVVSGVAARALRDRSAWIGALPAQQRPVREA